MSFSLLAREVDKAELQQLASVAQGFKQDSAVAVLLQNVISAVSRGMDVDVFAHDAELSPNAAADLLKVSRPHLLKFMDHGDLTFHYVGSHRRIRMSDLLEFIDRRERANAFVAEALDSGTSKIRQVRDEAAELNGSDFAELDAL